MPSEQGEGAKDGERPPVADAEYYDSAASHPHSPGGASPESDEELSHHDGSEGTATARNDERTTLTEAGQTQRNLESDTAEHVAAEEGSGDQSDANLVQLPMGATFGMEHEPTPQEGEELMRFAAEANRELHGKDEADDQDAGQ